MRKCENVDCDYFKVYGECASVCTDHGIKRTITNGDYIRAMTDAEMSVFLNGNCVCDCCVYHAQGCIEAFNMSKCIDGVKQWLGQERKVDDGKEKEETGPGAADTGSDEKGRA